MRIQQDPRIKVTATCRRLFSLPLLAIPGLCCSHSPFFLRVERLDLKKIELAPSNVLNTSG